MRPLWDASYRTRQPPLAGLAAPGHAGCRHAGVHQRFVIGAPGAPGRLWTRRMARSSSISALYASQLQHRRCDTRCRHLWISFVPPFNTAQDGLIRILTAYFGVAQWQILLPGRIVGRPHARAFTACSACEQDDSSRHHCDIWHTPMARGTPTTKYGKVRKINTALLPRVYRNATHGSTSEAVYCQCVRLSPVTTWNCTQSDCCNKRKRCVFDHPAPLSTLLPACATRYVAFHLCPPCILFSCHLFAGNLCTAPDKWHNNDRSVCCFSLFSSAFTVGHLYVLRSVYQVCTAEHPALGMPPPETLGPV